MMLLSTHSSIIVSFLLLELHLMLPSCCAFLVNPSVANPSISVSSSCNTRLCIITPILHRCSQHKTKLSSLQTSLEESLNVGLPIATTISLASLAYYTYKAPLFRLRAALPLGPDIKVGEDLRGLVTRHTGRLLPILLRLA